MCWLCRALQRNRTGVWLHGAWVQGWGFEGFAWLSSPPDTVFGGKQPDPPSPRCPPPHHLRLATHMPPSSLLTRSHTEALGRKEHAMTDTCWCWTEPDPPRGAYLVMGSHLKLVPRAPDQHPQCRVPCQQVNDERQHGPPGAAERRVGARVQAEVQEVLAALVHLACVRAW